MKRFHLVYVVWGDAFLSMFEEAALPNLLSQLDRLSAEDKAGYTCRIYTVSRDKRRLEESAPFLALEREIRIEIVLIDDLVLEKKYDTMAECHRRALAAALKDRAIILFMAVDALFSDGMLPVLQEHARKGIRIVLISALRVRKESALPLLRARFLADGGKRLAVSSRELMAAAMEHLHGFTRSVTVNSDEFDGGWPSYLDWRVGREGILRRCFHLHPLLVDPAGMTTLPSWVLDDDLVCRLPRSPGDCHVVIDSDEMLLCEFCPTAEEPPPRRGGRLSLFRVAAWAANNTKADHRRYFGERIYFHSGDLSPRWREAERESDRAARIIARLLIVKPLLFNVRAFLSRNKTLKRLHSALKTRTR